MAKSAIEKALEKQNKANAKAEREAKNRQIAESIIAGQPTLFGVRPVSIQVRNFMLNKS